MEWYAWNGGDLLVEVRVQPRASRDEVCGVAGGRLRLRVTAPPVDGQANQRATELLAKCFSVSKSGVRLVRGQTGRDKRFLIQSPSTPPDQLDLPGVPAR